MPFPVLNLRPFTWANINRIPAGRQGVLGIYNAQAWFGIEGAADVRARMIELYEEDAALEAFGPTGFYFEILDTPAERAAALIGEYRAKGEHGLDGEA